jgi:hypothetical protein
MQVRIESDGTAANTHVIDESGFELKGIHRIEWSIDVVTKLADAKIYLHRVPVQLTGDAVTLDNDPTRETGEPDGARTD